MRKPWRRTKEASVLFANRKALRYDTHKYQFHLGILVCFQRLFDWQSVLGKVSTVFNILFGLTNPLLRWDWYRLPLGLLRDAVHRNIMARFTGLFRSSCTRRVHARRIIEVPQCLYYTTQCPSYLFDTWGWERMWNRMTLVIPYQCLPTGCWFIAEISSLLVFCHLLSLLSSPNKNKTADCKSKWKTSDQRAVRRGRGRLPVG